MPTRLIMCKYWTGCVKLLTENGLNSSPTTGSSIVTPSHRVMSSILYIYIYVVGLKSFASAVIFLFTLDISG